MKNQRNGKVLLKKCTIFGLVISETNIKVKSILFQIIIFYLDSGPNVKTEILLFKENPVVYCKCLLASGLYVFLYIYIYLSIYLSIHSILMRTILESIYEKYLNWEFTHWYIDVYHYLTVTISITKMILWGYSELSKAKICI